MKNFRKFSLWLLACFVFFATAQVACSSDDPPANNAGSGGSTAGSGGSLVGGGTQNGGASGSVDAGGSAGDNGGWKKGVVGKATKGAIVLAEGAGQIQGFSITSLPAGTKKFMDGELDAGDEAGINTVPAIDLSGITPDFTEMWFPVPPYMDTDVNPVIPPYTVILKPDGSTEKFVSFPDWKDQFTLSCFRVTTPMEVNGSTLRGYGGITMDMTDCLNRHFFITNASDKVWELFADGTRSLIADGIYGASSIICDPQGFLLVSSLPIYDDMISTLLPQEGIKLYKLPLTGGKELLLTLDHSLETEKPFSSLCRTAPESSLMYPQDIRAPLTIDVDGNYLLGDVLAKSFYKVDRQTKEATTYSDMPLFTSSAIVAPNSVLYAVDVPVLGTVSENTTVASGTKMLGYNGSGWTSVLEVEGYESYVERMTDVIMPEPCPSSYGDAYQVCYRPIALYIKVLFGATPVLYVMDPVMGKFFAIPLDMEDAGS